MHREGLRYLKSVKRLPVPPLARVKYAEPSPRRIPLINKRQKKAVMLNKSTDIPYTIYSLYTLRRAEKNVLL